MTAVHYTKTTPTVRLNVRTACGRRSITLGSTMSPLATTTVREKVTCRSCLDTLAKADRANQRAGRRSIDAALVEAARIDPLDLVSTEADDVLARDGFYRD